MIHRVSSDVALGSRVPVVAALQSSLATMAAGSWFDPTNPYLDPTEQKRQFKAAAESPFSGTISANHMSSYLASAAISHSVDAWTYIARALAAVMSLTPSLAHHLAYYAELRAALSILAAEGIGIFDDHHFVVDALGETYELTYGIEARRTHQAVWKALVGWAASNTATSTLSRVLRLDGYGFDDWLQSCGTSASPALQCGAWFRDWGVDLGALPREQIRRNAASYSPSRGAAVPPSLEDVSDFVRSIWTALAPDTATGFGVLDRHLLRIAVEKALHLGHANRFPQKITPRDTRITAALRRLDPHLDNRWHDFLSRRDEPQSLSLLLDASISATNAAPSAHQMIARAILLARFATGISRLLLRDAGATAADLGYWQAHAGEYLGLWNPGQMPDDLNELWSNVIEELDAYPLTPISNPPDVETFHDWRRRCIRQADIATQCERVPIWALS